MLHVKSTYVANQALYLHDQKMLQLDGVIIEVAIYLWK